MKTPNNKHQITNNFEIPMTETDSYCYLEDCNLSEICNLNFGIYDERKVLP